MKPVSSIVAGFFAMLFVMWIGWVLLATAPCERIYRMTEPLRQGGSLIRAAAHNWIDEKDRFEMLVTQIQADSATQKFLQRQFYGDLKCSKG